LYGSVKKKMNEWKKLEQTANDDDATKTTTTSAAVISASDSPIVVDGSLSNAPPAVTMGMDTLPDATINVLPATSNTMPSEPVPFLSLPDRKSFMELVKLSGPIFFVILAKIACYGAMTLRATDFGVIPLAAHNIMMRIYFFYGTFGDSISQTAQTYLPGTLYPKLDVKSFQKILRRLITISIIVSVVNSQACVLILKHCGRFLVQNKEIISLMSENSGFVGLALMFHPFIMFLEGTVIASRDFRPLIMTYIATLGLHFTVLSFFCKSFPAIWRTFFVFQVIRAGSFSWNVWIAIRKRDKEDGEPNVFVTE
jgi:Na+-driven multidrug efflux pump